MPQIPFHCNRECIKKIEKKMNFCLLFEPCTHKRNAQKGVSFMAESTGLRVFNALSLVSLNSLRLLTLPLLIKTVRAFAAIFYRFNGKKSSASLSVRALYA